VLEGILVGIIDASLLRKAMQSCSGVDSYHDEPLDTPIVLVRIVASQRLDPVRPEDAEHSETAAESGE
jgi:hypothetical protein